MDKAGIDTRVFSKNQHFTSVISDIASSLQSSAHSAALALKFTSLCLINGQKQNN
jgi:hypothetical protein